MKNSYLGRLILVNLLEFSLLALAEECSVNDESFFAFGMIDKKNINFWKMEKSKFTPLARKSAQNKNGKYAVNKPIIKHTKSIEFTGSFTSLFNKKPKSVRIDAKDGYSRLSVLNRVASMTK